MTVVKKATRKACNIAENHQVCARGWQDYMMETRLFMGEERVGRTLRSMSGDQLHKLGLNDNEVARIKSR